jgi:hypothetical protein
MEYKANAGVFYAIDRPDAVIVSTKRNSWTGTLEWIVDSHRENERFVRLFAGGGTLLLRTGSMYGSIHAYVQPMTTKSGPLAVQSLPHRRWSAEFTVTGAPVGNRKLEEGGTYEDVITDFTTYEAVTGEFLNYYSLWRYEVDV